MNITNDIIVDAVENYFQDIHYAVVECDYNVIANNILSNVAKQIAPEIIKQTKIKKIKMLLQNGTFGKLIDYKVYESVFNSIDKNINRSSVGITSKQINYDFTCIINEFFEENTHIKFIYAMILNDEHGPNKYISVGTNENSYVFGIVYKAEQANENGFCCATIALINCDGDNYKEFIERKLNKLTGGSEMVNDENVNKKEKVKKINPADVQDENGDTLLHIAVEEHKDDVVKTLLEQGANPNIKNKSGETPIIKTFYVSYYDDDYCDIKAFKLLLEHGAEIEDICEELISKALNLYCSDDRNELLSILLLRIKHFHVKIGSETTTILHLATKYCKEIINEIMNKAKSGEYDDYEEN